MSNPIYRTFSDNLYYTHAVTPWAKDPKTGNSLHSTLGKIARALTWLLYPITRIVDAITGPKQRKIEVLRSDAFEELVHSKHSKEHLAELEKAFEKAFEKSLQDSLANEFDIKYGLFTKETTKNLTIIQDFIKNSQKILLSSNQQRQEAFFKQVKKALYETFKPPNNSEINPEEIPVREDTKRAFLEDKSKAFRHFINRYHRIFKRSFDEAYAHAIKTVYEASDLVPLTQSELQETAHKTDILFHKKLGQELTTEGFAQEFLTAYLETEKDDLLLKHDPDTNRLAKFTESLNAFTKLAEGTTEQVSLNKFQFDQEKDLNDFIKEAKKELSTLYDSLRKTQRFLLNEKFKNALQVELKQIPGSFQNLFTEKQPIEKFLQTPFKLALDLLTSNGNVFKLEELDKNFNQLIPQQSPQSDTFKKQFQQAIDNAIARVYFDENLPHPNQDITKIQQELSKLYFNLSKEQRPLLNEKFKEALQIETQELFSAFKDPFAEEVFANFFEITLHPQENSFQEGTDSNLENVNRIFRALIANRSPEEIDIFTQQLNQAIDNATAKVYSDPDLPRPIAVDQKPEATEEQVNTIEERLQAAFSKPYAKTDDLTLEEADRRTSLGSFHKNLSQALKESFTNELSQVISPFSAVIAQTFILSHDQQLFGHPEEQTKIVLNDLQEKLSAKGISQLEQDDICKKCETAIQDAYLKYITAMYFLVQKDLERTAVIHTNETAIKPYRGKLIKALTKEEEETTDKAIIEKINKENEKAQIEILNQLKAFTVKAYPNDPRAQEALLNQIHQGFAYPVQKLAIDKYQKILEETAEELGVETLEFIPSRLPESVLDWHIQEDPLEVKLEVGLSFTLHTPTGLSNNPILLYSTTTFRPKEGKFTLQYEPFDEEKHTPKYPKNLKDNPVSEPPSSTDESDSSKNSPRSDDSL